MYSEIYQNSIIDDSPVLDKEDLKKRLKVELEPEMTGSARKWPQAPERIFPQKKKQRSKRCVPKMKNGYETARNGSYRGMIEATWG